jgi:retron-type reverse transcriptase
MNRRQLARACTLENVASIENLFAAAHAARRGKSRRPDVEDWWLRRESEILRLHAELKTGTWQPGGYRFFTIHEPKRREIAAAPFADRVVHHALCRLMAPVLERRFVPQSYSCQLGKGTTAAREACRRLTNRYRYVLKCDVRKFFPSIDHAILRERLAERIRCPGVLDLCARILASYPGCSRGPAGCEARVLGTAHRPVATGLPIGNLTSQLWGNFVLDALDHRLATGERHGAFVRYTDDVLLFHDDPARLWALRGVVRRELAALRLVLAEPKSRLLASREGVSFCGFRFFPGRRPRVLGATKRRFERRHRWHGHGEVRRLSVTVFAWYQFSREGNTAGLRRAWASRRRLQEEAG